MGTSVRIYLHQADGSLRPISQRLAADLREGRATLPEFAGSAQKVVVLLIEFAARQPQGILKVQGQVWRFDDEGGTADSMRRENRARIELLPGALGDLPPGVADARPAIALRKLDVQTRWTVPDEVISRIVAILGR